MKTYITLSALLIVGLFTIACEPSRKADDNVEIAREDNTDTQKKKPDEPRDLQGAITGKWQLTDMATNKSAGVWDFQTDGSFQSTGHFLSAKDASFRTNESSSIIFIQVGEEITEWEANLTDKEIILKEVLIGDKTNPVKFKLIKVEVD